MATMMPPGPAMTPADPSAAGMDPNAAETASPGYKICIAVDAQGQITVGTEDEDAAPPAAPGAMSAGQPASEDDSDESMQPVANIKDALTMALQIYKSNGQMSAPSDEQDQFKAGFSGAAQ